ncbi:PIG-L domain-containing protein [Bacteroidia bacterium]|nr:PIG-L domain-containing protein [Bacteroidia bacterium]
MDKVLIIAPHADDEILGCGATIAKHVSKGDEVFIIIATNAHVGAPELVTKEGIINVRNEALNAHKFLGVTDTIFLDFPAPALNSFPEYKISLAFSKIMKNIRPTILYLPHHGDMHQDHKAIYRAALVSARPQGENKILSILSYETLSETEWAPMQEKAFIPNCFIDVSSTFDAKLKAMSYYKSQLKQFPHSRSIEAIEALAKYRGSTIGVERAEAFMIERQILI